MAPMTSFDSLRGPALIGGQILPDVSIAIAGGRIARIDRAAPGPAPGHSLHRPGGLIAPGFIDLHVHGGGGADFMDDDARAIEAVLDTHARHGTTALLATTLSAPPGDLLAALSRIADFRKSQPAGGRILGVHIEGPYLNPYAAGAQEPRFLRTADVAEIDRWISRAGDGRLLVTLAPEVAGSIEAVRHLTARGAIVSFGHTRARFEDVERAVAAGARHAAHLYNAMSPLHHREPGAVGAALTLPGVSVELIADGVHVHPAALALACRARAEEEVVLVTDAMRLSGCPEGARGKLLDREVAIRDGAPRLSNGTLAGSALTLDRAVATIEKMAGIPRERALRMASEFPARILELEDRKGRIAEGLDADLVVLDADGRVELTLVAGETVFEAS
jgi:N-acetylglucosamine-6-phosphate deacetylase